MPKTAQRRDPLSVIITGGKPALRPDGTRLAIIDQQESCGLSPAGNGWGGARNRADRVTEYLSLKQCEGLIAAADRAYDLGLRFNRHWIVHYEKAGVAPEDAARFVGRLLKLAGDHARRHGGELAAIWAREGDRSKGGHVHILMHLPTGVSLRGKTAKWVRLAGGICRAKVSKVKSIAGRLVTAENGNADYWVNLQNVVAYLLKGANKAAGRALCLPRYGERALMVGKRCGRTENLGKNISCRKVQWIEPSSFQCQ